MGERRIRIRDYPANGEDPLQRFVATVQNSSVPIYTLSPQQECGKIVQIQLQEANKARHPPYNARENCHGQNY